MCVPQHTAAMNCATAWLVGPGEAAKPAPMHADPLVPHHTILWRHSASLPPRHPCVPGGGQRERIRGRVRRVLSQDLAIVFDHHLVGTGGSRHKHSPSVCPSASCHGHRGAVAHTPTARW